MTKNERVKKVRSELKLTQTEFGKKIAVAQGYMASIEKGEREVTPKIAKLISSEYGVNEEWIETGEGEMFKSEETLFGLLGAKLKDLDETDRKILIEYIKLTPAQRKIIKTYISNI
jgi:transcriptional regulator with XRE-family HTH domain